MSQTRIKLNDKQQIARLKTQNQQLNDALKRMNSDPNGVVAPAIHRLQLVIEQNKKLAALVAVLIKNQGPITLPVTEFDVFDGNKLDILFSPSEDKSEVTFTYTLEEIEKPRVVSMQATPEQEDAASDAAA
jgi:hypothetical protein